MKNFWTVLIVILCLGFTGTSYAMESSSSAVQKYGITFPVSELGNCNSLEECKTYCEDLTNKDACISFAQKKGFYKIPKAAETGKATLISAARSELGCESESACKEFCGQQANWEKCGEFAKKHQLGNKKPSSPPSSDILEKAKQFLGCTTIIECKTLCSKEENREKCREFSKMLSRKPAQMSSAPKMMPVPSGIDVNKLNLRMQELCAQIKEKLANSSLSAEINNTYQQYCQSVINGSPRPTSPTPPEPPPPSPIPAVQGVTTESSLLQKFLNWLGF